MRGVELKYKREEFGYTQEEFADIIGISKRTLINWEQSDEIPKSKMHTVMHVINGEDRKRKNDVDEPYKDRVIAEIHALRDMISEDHAMLADAARLTFINTEATKKSAESFSELVKALRSGGGSTK